MRNHYLEKVRATMRVSIAPLDAVSGMCTGKAKPIIWGLWLLLLLGRVEAATITNYLTGYPNQWQYSLAVYPGDTVVWVNQYPDTNYVESYGGEWKSGPLRPGDHFAVTFTSAGFFAYRTADAERPGTVAVLAWADGPPAVAINAPVDRSVVPYQCRVQASVTNPVDLVSIEFFANSVFIGVATNSPYTVLWGSAAQSQYILMAKATDRQGRVSWSPPVSVVGGPQFGIWGPRRLPTGEMLFFYNAVPMQTSGYLATSDSPSFPSDVCSSGSYTNTRLLGVSFPGVFVDESVRGGLVPRRFYAVVPGVHGSCP